MCHSVSQSVKFRSGTTQVFTSSFDRTVKQFDLAALTYIDTLFGHQDTILDLDCLRNETALTAGGRDKSLRFWKVAEESQLVFRGGGTSRMRQVLEGSKAADDLESGGLEAEASAKGGSKGRTFVEGSAEVVAMIDESHFLSGGDSGSVCNCTRALRDLSKLSQITGPSLYGAPARRSRFSAGQSPTVSTRHTARPKVSLRTPDGSQRWLLCLIRTSLRQVSFIIAFGLALPLLIPHFFSGSWDGTVRFWRLERDLRSFKTLFKVAVPGVINGLHLVQPGNDEAAEVLCAVAAGQEHRLGRWLRVPEGKNEGVVLRLRRGTTA